jgi:hypothetical protein
MSGRAGAGPVVVMMMAIILIKQDPMPSLKTQSVLIRSLYALCLAGAARNHALIVLEHGWAWDYGGVAPFVAAFWTALTVLDPLAIVLLWLRPRAGLALTAAIIVSDVLINTGVGLWYGFDWLFFGAQALFMLVVLATVGRAWRGLAVPVGPALPADAA